MRHLHFITADGRDEVKVNARKIYMGHNKSLAGMIKERAKESQGHLSDGVRPANSKF